MTPDALRGTAASLALAIALAVPVRSQPEGGRV